MADLTASSSCQPTVRSALLGSGPFLFGSAILAYWVVCALFGRYFVPHDPFAADIMNVLAPPSTEHWFGTDQLGRDIFSRVFLGSRDILIVAPVATCLATLLGTALGLVTGYFRGMIDDVVSRLLEAVLALPTLIIALLIIVALGNSQTSVILVIGLSYAPSIARTVRSAVLSERDLEYVAAATLRRENAAHIMFVEILPNILPPILVESAVRLGYAIFAVATLSFIGFGLQPPSPDWGLSIATNYGMIGGGFWWTVLFDALAIASLVIGVNLMAEGLHGALDG
ncbi:ABC-type dipeptide/oligopeptide/nickel transport system, permease component [Mesorhizobium australicum WSM2073]|uniref:ABC-type dipeptide/oligopeptide/nickel transport system, permease component n=3 Tax=Mesorhizobium TaxID=68287 RepID=L0KTM2_MESAW|nr:MULTISPECIES: ABC transporter permease [Mesorhizobium]ADV14792.1 binding-protein-dependent transport systems inner membrane component [Mesorhizobium ciceri biovar biserrulae WSM1271]AEH90679.1 binding-protein-dependent transport systems inner membrane component [Mesorhizobium opportunistum WSM2075]AGB48050.1 ABC-type dipeptide/oligopeptide/nickel transport system, permease component [Mesorhizobium australicum WSM2073]OBP89858.1 peptide ABC transporter permease [Mesorhizobium loti]